MLVDGTIDLMSSRAVLEHFLDFPAAADRLFRLMRPGGIAAHVIDLVDHRAYVDPQSYHYWSFMAEGDNWSDGLINGLRAAEIRPLLEKAGFEILSYELDRVAMPTGFREKLAGRFKAMSDDELSVTTVSCVLRRP